MLSEGRKFTFLKVLKSFGVALSVLVRIQTHTSALESQEHSIIFPEYEDGSELSAI